VGLKARPTPKRANAPPLNFYIDYSDSQVPTFDDYFYVDAGYPEAISSCDL
jgi:hypothetical protein